MTFSPDSGARQHGAFFCVMGARPYPRRRHCSCIGTRMTGAGRALLLRGNPPLSGHRMTSMGSASQLATRGVQLPLPDERGEVARNVPVREEPPKGCPRHRRCPSACKKTCAFLRWAEGTWPCRAPCAGVKNHEGEHLCPQHWEVDPDDWHAWLMTRNS